MIYVAKSYAEAHDQIIIFSAGCARRLKVCFECRSPIEHKEGLREFLYSWILFSEYFLTLVLVPI